MSESLIRISAQQPVSSRTSRRAACSWVSRASTCPVGSDQTRGVPRPIRRASRVAPFRRKTSPPAETSYLIRIVENPLRSGGVFSKYTPHSQEGVLETAESGRTPLYFRSFGANGGPVGGPRGSHRRG